MVVLGLCLFVCGCCKKNCVAFVVGSKHSGCEQSKHKIEKNI